MMVRFRVIKAAFGSSFDHVLAIADPLIHHALTGHTTVTTVLYNNSGCCRIKGKLGMNMANGDQRHRILILGASGQIGSAVVSALETGSERPVVVRASRNRDQVDAWKHAGFEAVYLD